jgi:hypothetical protein
MTKWDPFAPHLFRLLRSLTCSRSSLYLDNNADDQRGWPTDH